jgi:hemoglobin
MNEMMTETMNGTATEEQIADLVRRFYARARADDRLGPLFEAAISDWDGHMKIVQDFWSHVLLGTSRYKSHPFPAHRDLPIELDHFDRWLDLFRRSAEEALPPAAARKVIARAEHMTESFRVGLFPFRLPDGTPSRNPPAVAAASRM